MPNLLPFPIVDSHVHFWDQERLDYPWLASVPPIAGTHLPKDYWKEAEGVPVGQLIFVEAGCATPLALQENDWALELAAENPRIAAIVAQVPIDAAEETARLLKIFASRPLIRGVRHIIQGATDPDFCLRPIFVKGVQRLADLNLSFDLCVHHTQLASVLRLVDQCPEVRFILDHVGKPGIRDKLMEPWKAHLHELAVHPNVWCKVSGLMTEADTQKWQTNDFQPYLAEAIAAFGADRLLFGSDWPVCRLAGSLNDWMGILLAALDHASPQTLKQIFAENAKTCYRL
jgi:L-fuconolactonase